MSTPRLIVLFSVFLTVALIGGSALGQTQGVRTYFDIRRGFYIHYPHDWKVVQEVPDLPFVVYFLDQHERAIGAVGEIIDDLPVELREATARAAIVEIVRHITEKSALAATASPPRLTWEGQVTFGEVLRGHYASFEAINDTPQRERAVVLAYFLADDGSGRTLPPGHVTAASLVFMAGVQDFRTFEPVFHQIAGSLRFVQPRR